MSGKLAASQVEEAPRGDVGLGRSHLVWKLKDDQGRASERPRGAHGHETSQSVEFVHMIWR